MNVKIHAERKLKLTQLVLTLPTTITARIVWTTEKGWHCCHEVHLLQAYQLIFINHFFQPHEAGAEFVVALLVKLFLILWNVATKTPNHHELLTSLVILILATWCLNTHKSFIWYVSWFQWLIGGFIKDHVCHAKLRMKSLSWSWWSMTLVCWYLRKTHDPRKVLNWQCGAATVFIKAMWRVKSTQMLQIKVEQISNLKGKDIWELRTY